MRTLLEDGRWSEESIIDLYEIHCSIDRKIKGYIFTPYERLEPDFCPLHSEPKLKPNESEGKVSIFQKFFNYFLKLKF